MSPNSVVLGYFVEGVVEQDPVGNRYLIRAVDAQGRPVQFDIRDALAKMVGKEVRLTLNSFENLAELARLVEESGPAHDKTFRVMVTLNGEWLSEGVGKSKKEAEQKAAEEAYLCLKGDLDR